MSGNARTGGSRMRLRGLMRKEFLQMFGFKFVRDRNAIYNPREPGGSSRQRRKHYRQLLMGAA